MHVGKISYDIWCQIFNTKEITKCFPIKNRRQKVSSEQIMFCFKIILIVKPLSIEKIFITFILTFSYANTKKLHKINELNLVLYYFTLEHPLKKIIFFFFFYKFY